MLAIKDLDGEVYPLTGVSDIIRKRRVNGEKEISLKLHQTKSNSPFFDDIDKLWRIIDFNGEEYPIMLFRDVAEGDGYTREFSCLHSFFDDMRNHVVYETFSSSKTFDDMMAFIFNGSGYSYNIIGTFYAREFENFGDDYGLELFKTATERYGAEFTVNGPMVNLRTQIGNVTDFQYRHKFNLESLEREVDALDFSTYGEGFGADGLHVTYTSPLAEIYGIRPIKAIRDDRFTDAEALTNRIKEAVESSLKITLTVKLSDLRAAGYNRNHPNEGDTIILVDDRLGGLKVDVRIVEIVEKLSRKGKVLDCDVTLSNFSNIFEQQRRIHNATKTIADAISGKRPLPFEALTIAVQQATIALQNAQTELVFPVNGGIMAVDKNDPNKIVIYNSAGLGVSDDGGQTFQTAVTGAGIVADLITVGTMSFDRAQGGTLKLGTAYSNGKLEVWADKDGDGNPDMIGTIDEYGAYFPIIQGDSIRGNVENRWMSGDVTYYFNGDTGNDSNDGLSWATAKKIPQILINSLPKNLSAKTFIFNLTGSFYGGLTMEDFKNGTIIVNGKFDARPRVFGRLLFNRCRAGLFKAQDLDIHGDQATPGYGMLTAYYSDYVQIYGCKVYGNNLATHGYWMRATRFSIVESHVYNISDRGLFAEECSTGYLEMGKGNPPVAILCTSGASVNGSGTRWGGSVVRWNLSNLGTYKDDGIWVTDPWNTNPIGSGISYGEAAPPPPPPAQEQTITIVPSTGDNWSTSGYWTNDEIKQGNYGYGDRYGLWYADLSAVKGKTIVQATIKVYRDSGGASAGRTIHFRTHRYTSRAGRPAGTPAMSGEYNRGLIAVGETKTFDITDIIQNNIANGIDTALGVHTGGSTDYMSLGTRPEIIIRYK